MRVSPAQKEAWYAAANRDSRKFTNWASVILSGATPPRLSSYVNEGLTGQVFIYPRTGELDLWKDRAGQEDMEVTSWIRAALNAASGLEGD